MRQQVRFEFKFAPQQGLVVIEALLRRSIAETFPRSCVEPVREDVTLALGQACHAGPFRKVLAEQAVEILVTAALPGVVRRREVHQDAGGGFEGLVVMKLCAVVGRERLEVVRGSSDQPTEPRRHALAGAIA
jgi:hypothetical protein